MWEMTLDELKPCPFCMSKNTGKTGDDLIHCLECDARASQSIWNNRPLEDNLVASALRLAASSCHMSFNEGQYESKG